MGVDITINGELRHLNGGLSLTDLLSALGQDPAKVAVERNLEIVPRSTMARWSWPTATNWRSCISSAAGTAGDKPLTIAGRTYKSRLIIGTGKYKTYAENAAALEASGAEIVTVAVRRVNLTDPSQPKLVDFIDPKKVTYLPNTAGCFTGEEAVRTLRLAREAGGWTLVKLEVLGDGKRFIPT